jgi:acetone carboxylase gamma subunit
VSHETSNPVPVHEYLLLDGRGPSASLLCGRCRARICGVDENYRTRAEVVTVGIETLGPLFRGAGHTVAEEVVWRTYHCPSCGQTLDGEICPASAEPLWDLQLVPPGGAA